MKALLRLALLALSLQATAVNYQVETVKKFPQATCVKLGKTESHASAPDEFFIASEPKVKNPQWLSREQPSCDAAWKEAYLRFVK